MSGVASPGQSPVTGTPPTIVAVREVASRFAVLSTWATSPTATTRCTVGRRPT
jgi:hypothetical protein